MSLLSWNCRGLGNLRAVRVLRDMIKSHQPDLVFLSETLSVGKKIEELALNFGFSNVFSVDRQGRGGGIAVMWKHSMECEVTDSSLNHIDIVVTENVSVKWRLTCYYGYPERERRREAWDFLRSLASRSQLPWCIVGDFNDLICSSDKKGRHPHPQNLLEGFRRAIEDCMLLELDLTGGVFTWEKSKGKHDWVRERLDRAFASNSWWQMFPLSTLSVFHAVTSDHEPIKLNLFNTAISKKQFRFKFENTWLKEESFHSDVALFWQNLLPSHLLPKLISVSAYMASWGRNFFHKFREKVINQKKVIDELKDREDMDGIQLYFAEKNKMDELLLHEELYWKQRAKAFWLEEGDTNSKFFHATASNRRKMNHISSLKTEGGNVVTSHEDLCQLLKNYYSEVFDAAEQDIDIPFNEIEVRVTEAQNNMLIADLSFEEFTEAIRSMHPDKASGPDGLNPAFYQHFWKLIGKEVYKCCQEWLSASKFSAGINDTTLVLIPKKEKVEDAKDLRPIALCNVLYKVVAKVLANRLQKILPVMISEEQSAFVPGRNITDNVMVAFELIHFMKRKTSGEVGEVALKLDISKAYDRVSWNYLRQRLMAMGFCNKWIKWMLLCVSSVSYSISFQGSMIGPITPKRGLRQGDPLSPYLFLLCVEGLSLSLKAAARSGSIQGCRICPQAPVITHLLFADDSFLFFKATPEEANSIKGILHSYETFSGQAVNFQKSAIFFSSNVRRDKQTELRNILGVYNDIGNNKYLGLPSLIGRSKKSVFSYLKDRVWKKIQGWNTKLLSRAGKAVLIRNVAQTIPTYTMSCFLIPKTLCQEIERMMSAFWWNSNSASNKGVKWLSWARMCMAKKKGGLGFRDLHGFNLALLGKQCWHLLKNPNALVSRLLKARYYPNCNLLEATRTGGASYVWSGLWEAKESIKDGFRWVLGNGNNINIFTDRWLRGKTNLCVEQDVSRQTETEVKVSEFFVNGSKEWDAQKVRATFSEVDAEAILSVRIPRNDREDRIAWVHSCNGQYSVKSSYHYWHKHHMLNVVPQQSDGWAKIWRLCIPHKIRILLWRLCRNNVPVRNLLRGKGINIPISCPMCVGEIEHILHLFFDCDFAKSCWQKVGLSYDMWTVENASDWLLNTLCTETNENLMKIATVLWGVWWARNKRVWENKVITAEIAMDWSSKQITDWRQMQKRKLQRENKGTRPNVIYSTRWVAPPVGTFKMNVDASVFEGNNFFSVGMVLRDHMGQFIHGRVLRYAGQVTVLEAELVGVLEALLWSNNFPGYSIAIESDSQLSVNAIKSTAVNHLEVGDLIEQCRTILNNRVDVSVDFVKKQANKVAHVLARIPCTLNSFIDLLSPPLHVLETLMSDVLIY